MPSAETSLFDRESVKPASKEDISSHEAAEKIIDVYEIVINTFKNGSEEFRLEPCSTPCHSLEHTEDVFMAVSDICHAMRKAGVDISNKEYKLAMTAALLHDIGYLKDSYPEDKEKREGGARHQDIHYIRSGVIAEEILDKQGWEANDIKAVRDLIFLKDNPEFAGHERFSPDAERLYKILHAADLLGQAASPRYVERLPLLYQELVEARPDYPFYGWTKEKFLEETAFMRNAVIKETEEARKYLREVGIDYHDKGVFRNLAARERRRIGEELTAKYIDKELSDMLDALERSGTRIKAAIVKSSALVGGGRWAEIDSDEARGWDVDVIVIAENLPFAEDRGTLPYRGKYETQTPRGNPQATELGWKRVGNCVKLTRAGEPEIATESPFRGPDCLVFTIDQMVKSIEEGNYKDIWLLKEALGAGLIISGELPKELAKLADEKIAPRELWNLERDEKFIAQREAPERGIFRSSATTLT